MCGAIFKKYINLFIVLLSINSLKAQLGKEAWHWQFGDSCSIDFSSGSPVTGTSAINTKEGCTSISNPSTGQLLFYTDGTKAWDRNNNQMPNGFGMIGGQGTSTQAALIVPKPGSTSIYFLISADQGGYIIPRIPNQGVNYSIVDMSLNGGFGDVVAGSKNLPLTPPPTTEKLTAVRHCNGTDYWIITHPFNSNAFNAYLVTSAGINTTPVISNVGTVESNGGTFQETIGYLKVSPNGKKLACAVYWMGFSEIFDFDNSTGIVTNPVKATYPDYGVYGVAFSPDNSKLYISNEARGVYQFDLSSNNAAAILASQTIISGNYTDGYVGAIQLAPDGKIYVDSYDSSHLAVINNPNYLGLSCGFQSNGPMFSKAHLLGGLPNFIDANTVFLSQSHNNSLCTFPAYTLNAASGSNYQWSDGDTTQNTSVNTFGNYWVSYFNTQGCKEVDTFHVTKVQAPVVNILHDTAQCSNLITPVTLDATDTNHVISYLWNNGFTSPIQTITNPGGYWVNYTFNNFCVSKDSFSYTIHTIPSINLGNDTTFCLGDLFLNASNPSSAYVWSTGQTTASITATKAETYWVKVTNQYGCVNCDTLIVHPETSLLDFTMPNIITPNNDNINDVLDFSKYQFSSLQLEIYNRWGNKVFESTNPNCIWKPTEDDGAYYYILQYIINCGTATQNKTLKGYITIIR